MAQRIVRRWWIVLGIIVLFAVAFGVWGLTGRSGKNNVVNGAPQYIAMHLSERDWYAGNPQSINSKVIEEILSKIGTRGTADRRLAFAFTISYLNVRRVSMLTNVVKTVLSLAEKHDIPVILHLDGVNWWEGRPDLWNWWDPDSPGYDPENAYNVEWYDWGPEYAVKLGWRNWGYQLRVLPQPNLASPAFLAAQDEALELLIPIIVEWYKKLPASKKYLLGGVVLGWEVSPYVQAYYYPDGNSYFEKYPDTSNHDPQSGISYSIPLGYAAATSMGIQHPGPITQEDIDSICGYYINHITSKARELGLPRSKIITHGLIFPGTNYGGEHKGTGALTANAVPGWSFYNAPPESAAHLLDELDGAPWAAIEFQPWNLSSDLFRRFFEYRNCRIINIYNWDQIRNDTDTIAAIKEILSEDVVVLSPPMQLSTTVQQGNVVFSWKDVTHYDSAYLLVSEKNEVDIAGILTSPNILHEDVTGKAEYTVSLPKGEYHWMIVVTAETESGGLNRMPTDVNSFTVQ